MAEYIDRKEAIKAIESMPNCYNGFSDTYDKACIIGVLEEIPSSDVVERKRGKWLHTPTFWAYCSVCGKEPPDETNITTPFCPNCGAEMVNYKPCVITNADRIRAMSDEELAEFLMKPVRIIPKYECEDCENDCTECVFEWLREISR